MELAEYRRHYELECDHWWFRGMRNAYRMLLQPVIDASRNTRSPLRILDVGCGAGGTTQWLQQFGRVVPMDISREALAWVKKRQLFHGVQGSAEQLPFQSQYFDLVTGLGVIEHLDDDTAALREMARVCRPSGWLLLLTSSYQFLWSHHDRANHHRRRYTARRLTAVLRESGWEPKRMSYVNVILLPIVVLTRLAQRWLDRHRRLVASDLQMPHPWVNSALSLLLRVEAQWLRYAAWPFGVSLVCLAQRLEQPRS